MGAGASSSKLPAELDRATVKKLAGQKFDEKKFKAAAGRNGKVTREAFLAAAAKSVQEDLHASRMLKEQNGTLCSNSGCAYICTGIVPGYCCAKCARSPGQHGPKCERRMLPCSTPGCVYGCTGLAPNHCCKMCAKDGNHGPHCWRCEVPSLLPGSDDNEDALQDAEEAADAPDAPPSAGLASASFLVAAAAKGAEAMAISALPDISEGDVEAVLEETVEKNQAAIDANAAVIEALKLALQEQAQEQAEVDSASALHHEDEKV